MKISIAKGQKIGIVAKNGEGKSTLLRMIAGVEEPDAGSIKIEPKRSRLFFLSVDLLEEDDKTVESYLLSLNPHLFQLHEKIVELSSNLGDDKKLDEFGEISSIYEQRGGYKWEESVLKITEILGLVGKQINHLSGGEKSRVLLGAIKLIDADLVVLDEPTNHLDIKALQDLENYIKHDQKAYIIVSHDQKFLDNVATRIMTIENKRLKIYEGNYSAFKMQKEMEENQAMHEYLSTEKELSRLDKIATKIADRSRAGMITIAPGGANLNGKRFTNTQGKRLKVSRDNDRKAVGAVNNKMESKLHGAKVVRDRRDRIERLAKPKKDWGIKVDFAKADVLPDFVLRTKNVAITLPGDEFSDLREFSFGDVIILSGEKVALVGPNGVGKSTFAKIVAGKLKPETSEVVMPESVNIGYYSQTHEDLNLKKNVLENLLNLEHIDDYEVQIVKEARNFLHQMLFEGDMAKQKAGDLSQGEKSKLALAKIIYGGANFLLLDEPTNHLDIPAKERIEEALRKYNGTMLVISHDRYFMESIGVSRYVEFE